MRKIILIGLVLFLFASTAMTQNVNMTDIDTTLVYSTDDFYTNCCDNGQCYIYSNNYRYYISFDGNEGEPAQPYIGVDIYYDNKLSYKSFSFELGSECLLSEDFKMFLVSESMPGVAASEIPIDLNQVRQFSDVSSLQRVVLSGQTKKWSEELGRLHFKVYLFRYDAEARKVYLFNEVNIKLLFEEKQVSGIKKLKQRLTVRDVPRYFLSGLSASQHAKKGVVIEAGKKHLVR